MITRDKIIEKLNDYLKVSETPEYNGLQVEGKDTVKKIVFGVSAHMELFKAAAQAKADMIITHHGLLWDKPQRITGVFGQRVSFLIKNNINLVSYHLPLDRHPEVGNNIQLAKLLGLHKIEPFGDYHGVKIGVIGKFAKPTYVENFMTDLRGEALLFGKERISTAAIVSGGAHNIIEQAVEAGVDFYLTGSRDEYIVEYCREAKVNFMAMGHYNSEKSGIKALMRYVKDNFDVETGFIDIPNPF
jgi:dinuclear metal center YbgI/SA1388 family protein